jgi:hypothetical protein
MGYRDGRKIISAPLTPEYQAIFEADESEGSVRSSRVNHQGEVDMDVHRHLLLLVTLAAVVTPASAQQVAARPPAPRLTPG